MITGLHGQHGMEARRLCGSWVFVWERTEVYRYASRLLLWNNIITRPIKSTQYVCHMYFAVPLQLLLQKPCLLKVSRRPACPRSRQLHLQSEPWSTATLPATSEGRVIRHAVVRNPSSIHGYVLTGLGSFNRTTWVDTRPPSHPDSRACRNSMETLIT